MLNYRAPLPDQETDILAPHNPMQGLGDAWMSDPYTMQADWSDPMMLSGSGTGPGVADPMLPSDIHTPTQLINGFSPLGGASDALSVFGLVDLLTRR